MLVRTALVCLGALALAASVARAEEDGDNQWIVEEGEVETKAGTTPWVFIGSHCFDNDGDGVMRWKIELEDPKGNLIPVKNATTGYQFALYDDQQSSMPSVWGKQATMTCDDLLAARRNVEPLNIPYGMDKLPAMVEKFKDRNAGHQWFAVVAGCGTKSAEENGMKFKYSLEWQNSNNTAKNFELTDVPAPTAIYAILMIIGLALFGFSIVFRTIKAGVPILMSHGHRLLLAGFVLMLIANICQWAFSGGHEPSAISAFLFFTGLQHMVIMWILLLIAVSNVADRSFIDRILGDVVFGFAGLYFVFWWVMGFEEFFPGVVGATVYSNGLTITATIFRAIIGLIWPFLFFRSWTSDKGTKASPIVGLILGVLAVFWLWVPTLTVWITYGQMFSCNPTSLLANTWVNFFFDGGAMIILCLIFDVQWSGYLHGHMLIVAPSLLASVNPHMWDATWEVNGGGSGGVSYGHLDSGSGPSTGTAGVMVDDDDVGQEIPETSGGEHKSYGTL